MTTFSINSKEQKNIDKNQYIRIGNIYITFTSLRLFFISQLGYEISDKCEDRKFRIKNFNKLRKVIYPPLQKMRINKSINLELYDIYEMFKFNFLPTLKRQTRKASQKCRIRECRNQTYSNHCELCDMHVDIMYFLLINDIVPKILENMGFIIISNSLPRFILKHQKKNIHP